MHSGTAVARQDRCLRERYRRLLDILIKYKEAVKFHRNQIIITNNLNNYHSLKHYNSSTLTNKTFFGTTNFTMLSFKSLTSLVALANVALAIQGSATFYMPNHGVGHCGWPINNIDWAVALPNSHYAGGAHCGKGIVVTYNGKTLTGTVADSCPSCSDNQLDLDEGFFDQFELESVGRISIDWHFA